MKSMKVKILLLVSVSFLFLNCSSLDVKNTSDNQVETDRDVASEMVVNYSDPWGGKKILSKVHAESLSWRLSVNDLSTDFKKVVDESAIPVESFAELDEKEQSKF